MLRVHLEPGVVDQPVSGRLVIYMIGPDASTPAGATPIDGPFWDDPQPMYGLDVTHLAPGRSVTIGDDATAFPAPLSELPPGEYRAQAVLDTRRLDSDWRREPGNLYSDEAILTIRPDAPHNAATLTLRHKVPEPETPDIEHVHFFQIRSELLSDFRGRDVYLRAGVVAPTSTHPDRRYPAVYEVPGFGGNHLGAAAVANARQRNPDSDHARLLEECFWIVLDPESPNGHHLFADSANNGPVGRALVEELIPALEQRFPLIPRTRARLLRGHSSGGWSVLWLALNYPDTFGAAWSTSPDPVDFTRFQLINIYQDRSAYFTPDGEQVPSYRVRGEVKMSIREENLIEQVMGEGTTNAQQWASWQAVFGPRADDGDPALLFDPATGEIDRQVAATYRAYDIADRVRRGPDAAGLIFHQRIRLLCGDEDNFYLEKAVRLLKEEVDKLSFLHYPEGGHGYIRMLEGHDHYTIHAAPEALGIPGEMLEHLARTTDDGQ